MLSRQDVIKDIFHWHGQDSIYVTNTGFISRDVYNLFPNNKNIFYMQGSMGLAPCIGLGMAANSQKDVVVISGDASLLMHLGITHTIKEQNLKNLFVYVLDNGCHESVGGQPTVAQKISLSKVASTLGYQFAQTVQDKKDFIFAINKAKEFQSTSFIEVLVRPGHRSDIGRPTTTPNQNKTVLMKTLKEAM